MRLDCSLSGGALKTTICLPPGYDHFLPRPDSVRFHEIYHQHFRPKKSWRNFHKPTNVNSKPVVKTSKIIGKTAETVGTAPWFYDPTICHIQPHLATSLPYRPTWAHRSPLGRWAMAARPARSPNGSVHPPAKKVNLVKVSQMKRKTWKRFV